MAAQASVGGNTYSTIQEAFDAATEGSTVFLEGAWTRGGALQKNNVKVVGAPGTTIVGGGAVWGKGALVIAASGCIVQGIEISGVSVPDGNGAAIRFEGAGNLTVDSVHFHDNQNGLLANPGFGLLTIKHSLFERNGYNASSGYAHGVYANGGAELLIQNSQFLRSKLGGHEVKSRADKTTIEDSVIATLDGVDSRNIDCPDGGVVTVRRSVIQHGPNSENGNAIGIGLEGVNKPVNSVLLEGNYIILERDGPNTLLDAAAGVSAMIRSNTIVGQVPSVAGNTHFASRDAAGIAAHPFLPPAGDVVVTPPPVSSVNEIDLGALSNARIMWTAGKKKFVLRIS